MRPPRPHTTLWSCGGSGELSSRGVEKGHHDPEVLGVCSRHRDPGTQAHRTKAPRHGAPTGPCGRWPSAAPQGRPCQASEASPGPAGASPLPGVLAVLRPQRRPTCSPAHLASARGAREPRTETKLTRVRRAGRHSLHTRTLKKNHSFDSSAKKNLANLQQNCQVIKARHFTHELKLLIKIPSLN